MATVAPPNITALDDFDESINILVFADHGVGKTVLAGTMGPSGLIVATENGAIAAKRQGSEARIVRINEWPELDKLYKWLKAQLERNGKVVFNGKRITWLAIDTGTEMQDLCIRHILNLNHAANAARDIDIPALPDYGKWYNSFKRFVKAFNDLQINILWLAASMQEENEDGDTIVRPSFAGKLGTPDQAAMSKWVCGTMQAYGHMVVRRHKETREEYRRLIMRPPFGKDRYNITGGKGYIDNPTIPMIESLILAPTETKPTRPRRRVAAATAVESE